MKLILVNHPTQVYSQEKVTTFGVRLHELIYLSILTVSTIVYNSLQFSNFSVLLYKK